MQGYSIAGYLNAVLRRSEKTMLVEGVTDKSVLMRLKNERCSTVGTDLPGVIDVAGLLTDDVLKGLGMKAVVKVVQDRLAQSPRMLAAAGDKFGTLTDREWDGLTVDMELESPWFAPDQGSPNFVTIGHSVENYFFRLAPIDAFLRQFFSDHLSQNFFNDLAERFRAIIGFAVVYSLAIRHIGAIGRADRLISHEMIEWHKGSYLSTARLNIALSNRGVVAAQNPYLLINYGVWKYAERYTAPEPWHWLCHGHLGEQAIWACVASLASEQGISPDVATQIERGLIDVRFRHCVDYLCRDADQTNTPLDSAIDWLTT